MHTMAPLTSPVIFALALAAVVGCRSSPMDARVSEAVILTVSEAEPQVVPPPREVALEGGVIAMVDAGVVSMPGWIELQEGWLEVGVCRQGTREHETVVATTCRPSVVHAAMLLAGFEPGSPAWYRADGSSGPATGDPVAVEIHIEDESGSIRVLPLAAAIDDARGAGDLSWVFAGSAFQPNPPQMGPGEFYVADYAGTIVGLTTFGDEVVAAVEVRSPEIGIDPAVWKIRPGVLPPPGSQVTLVLRRPREDRIGD
ncbi:MAG: hypothetical protein CMJ34_11625 [Phycisphaerae bacterium]|nr:hypothetical protein [Phycisphaerae bacterium]